MNKTREAFTTYAENSWPRLFRTAYALTGDVVEADDLLQATLIKVFTHWTRVHRADRPDAYVRRMMVNQAISRSRSPRARHERPMTEIVETASDLGGFEDRLASNEELWQAVQTLPARQRAVLVLRYYEDLSEREIAAALDVAPGTVKSLASAAVRHLRTSLSETAATDSRGAP